MFKRWTLWQSTFVLSGLVLVSLFLSMGFGAAEVGYSQIWQCLTVGCERSVYQTILMDIRLPRVLMGFLAGFALAAAGALMQNVTRNPLADPYLFGIVAGAGLGATIAGLMPEQVQMITLPLAAFISSVENMAQLRSEPPLGHITSFGGNPLSCAAGMASFKVIQGLDLKQTVENRGIYMAKKIRSMPGVKAVRQLGFFMAIDLENEDVVNKLVLNLLKKGLITFWFLSHPSSFRLAPPLLISDSEIEWACSCIQESLEELL